MVAVLALLFDNVIASPICPPGTIIKYLDASNIVMTVGSVQDDGTVAGFNFSELKRYVHNADSRQTCNRLHVVIDGESIGLSVLMARALPQTTSGIKRLLLHRKLPPFIIKLYRAWQQGYKDVGAPPCHFPRVTARYSHFYPDNHIYDADHVIARHAGGNNSLENIQAISLPSHRVKTNIEMARLRKKSFVRRFVRSGNRRCRLRANARYKLRVLRRVVDYRER